MKIRRMTATFGGLERAELTPGDGLSVITAPNEAGKSTWAGFLKAMLYGVDTRERDKTGFLADKTRYQPWSGEPMAGELTVEWEGKEIVVRRFASKTNPFGGFEAVYAATGDPVPGLTAANVGEKLTGVSKEVYLRSAFVGQGGAAINPSGELEARISALATSGQEDVSYSETNRRLKDWRNRRRSNRSNGLLPDLEGELSDLERSLEREEQARSVREEAGERLKRLEEERGELKTQLELWERIEKHELNRRYAEAAAQLEQAREARAKAVPPDPEMEGWTAQEARDWAAEQVRRHRAAGEARQKALERRACLEQETRRSAQLLLILVVVLAAAGLAIGVLGGLELVGLNPNWCFYCLIGAAAALMYRSRLRLNGVNRVNVVEIPEEVPAEDWEEQAQRHADYLTRREGLEREVRHARQRLDDLAAQGGQLADTLEFLHTPERSRAEVSARLNQVNAELARWQGEQARAEGALTQMGDPDELEARRDALEGERARRMEEYDALTIAMEALDAANSDLRQRFSPALNRRAGEIFAALTGGRYPGVSLARDFTAVTTPADSLLPRCALALSSGTREQLYLAVRLAICRLSLPGAPIVLDDALAAFDDVRMALALDYLRKMDGQVLLFSCHSREARWAREHNVMNLTLPQSKSE